MNNQFEYKLVFELIESALKRNLNISVFEFEKRILPFKDLKYFDFRNRSEENIFWVFSYICFFGQGDQASVIERHFQDIHSLLCKDKNDEWYSWEVDYAWLANLTPDEENRFIHNTLKFGRWGNTEKKGNIYLRYIIQNAKKFRRLVKDNSFVNYVAETFHMSKDEILKIDIKKYKIDDPEIKSLISLVKRDFKGIGSVTAPHLLGDLGFNVTKPDKVVCRVLGRLGLINESLNKEDQEKEAIRQINVFAEATGHVSRYIDAILVKFGQKGDSPLFGTMDGICSVQSPKCKLCDASDFCRHYLQTR